MTQGRLTKAEEPSLPYYLRIAGGRIIGFIPFPRVLVLCEMQSVSSRIWTRVAGSISYDDNDYTTYTYFMGIFYKPRKARFIPTFCKRINRTSTAVGNWWQLLKKGRRTTFSATKFIYNNNNNNKQGFTPNGTNNEYIRVHKRVQDSDRC